MLTNGNQPVLDIKEVYGDRVVLKKIDSKKHSFAEHSVFNSVLSQTVDSTELGIVTLLPISERHTQKNDHCECYHRFFRVGDVVAYDRFVTHQKHMYNNEEYIIIEGKYVFYSLENK